MTIEKMTEICVQPLYIKKINEIIDEIEKIDKRLENLEKINNDLYKYDSVPEFSENIETYPDAPIINSEEKISKLLKEEKQFEKEYGTD